jgi:hypothetical protein
MKNSLLTTTKTTPPPPISSSAATANSAARDLQLQCLEISAVQNHQTPPILKIAFLSKITAKDLIKSILSFFSSPATKIGAFHLP